MATCSGAPRPPRGLYWVSEGVAGSARLRSLSEVEWLALRGFKLVVSLTEEPLPRELVEELGRRGIEWCWEPVPDFSPPTVEQVERVIALIRGVERRGGKALVHCGAGLGRTGTVLACYLVSRGLTAEQAIGEVRLARPGAVEAVSQVAFVYAYEALLRSREPRASRGGP